MSPKLMSRMDHVYVTFMMLFCHFWSSKTTHCTFIVLKWHLGHSVLSFGVPTENLSSVHMHNFSSLPFNVLYVMSLSHGPIRQLVPVWQDNSHQSNHQKPEKLETLCMKTIINAMWCTEQNNYIKVPLRGSLF